MKTKALHISCLLAAVTMPEANADIISADNIGGQIASSTTPLATSDTDPNVTASGISIGTGLSAATATSRYNASGWTTGGTIDANDYFTFTLDANDGYVIDYSSFSFTGQGNGGPKFLQLEYCINGSPYQPVGTALTATTNNTRKDYSIDLSGEQFQNLTDTVTFRLYGYNAVNSTGQFSINSYSINGYVDTAPEPQTLSLIGVGSLLMFGYLRRTRDQGDVMA
jgi:hypothetical protein